MIQVNVRHNFQVVGNPVRDKPNQRSTTTAGWGHVELGTAREHLFRECFTHLFTFQVYKQILDTKYSVFDNPVILERFRLIVGSLVILFEPISADSLACLLQGTSSVSIISTLRQLRPVFTFGGSTSLIRTPHSSFHNFLTDEKSCPSPFFIDRQQQHAMLAERCFKVMTNLFNQTRALSEIYIRPGLVYGLCYWDSHLHTSSFDKAPFLLEQLRVFVKSQLKQWLCALFWSSALAHAILSVKNAHSWVVS